MDAAASGSQSSLVSKLIQVALGLFVSTVELPVLTPEQAALPHFGFDCNFDSACRWSSTGGTANHWLLAKGDPDKILWFAVTGTMALPSQPFTLIELRSQPADSLTSDLIPCQNENARFGFTYWTMGTADLEICLLDEKRQKFNCTGMLQSHVQPGQVKMELPAIKHPFYISLIPDNHASGILVLDDIRYEATPCGEQSFTTPERPDFVLPWTLPSEVPTTQRVPSTLAPTTTTSTTAPTPPPTLAPTTTAVVSTAKTDPPFELLVIGNLTRPLFDRRRGDIVGNTNRLLCDFGGDFPCQWGPEAGKWAIIEKGAIPSLEQLSQQQPSFPAALVIQGTAMLTSDPINCQTGSGSLLFRYWSNGDILLQACALGHKENSDQIQCAEEVGQNNVHLNGTLAVFEFPHSISEPFTLNIVPMWAPETKDKYLVIDEIAYVGNCTASAITSGVASVSEVIVTRAPQTFPPLRVTTPKVRPTLSTAAPTLPTRFTKPLPETDKEFSFFSTQYPRLLTSTRRPITHRYISPSTSPPTLDYCQQLNCDFNDNACNYLNHGLTKVPWTLRNKGYGFPLTRATDIRPSIHNSQFVSTILAPGEFAILESPSFNMTQSINVLLFDYYRPTHSTTVRLCLGTTHTKPLRTVTSFTQCPPILRSLSAKNANKWNKAHIQLSAGTTHFYLVAHNTDRNSEKAAIALDNLRVALCDLPTFDSEDSAQLE